MLRNVSLRHLRCFVAVANAGSFTVAASRLFLTQSSLTATIQQFEESVGVKLFDRNTRRVAMTQEAVRFKVEAEKILSQFDGALSDLQAFSKGHQGHVRIAAAASVINHFLADAIHGFRQTYPNITISLRDAGAELVERMVSAGEIDFAVTSRHKGYDDLIYTPLFEDRYGVVCTKDHALAAGRGPLRWDALDPADYVGFTADTGIGAYLRANTPNSALFDGTRDEISSTTSLYAVLRCGGRYSILPALPASVGEFAQFRFRELTGPKLAREVCLITRRLRSLSPSSEQLLRFIREEMRKKPVPPGVRILEARKRGGTGQG
ncbi:HTH-type transcriptional regulator CynR [Achromobacter deleyi]|uniref:HTH-type transcriptional regulator CynR n=1 Tax=Achromobacter deleyi TaxID=1353891 RepID=A0A6S7A1R9_9BURK|nr:LysR family transcriptional regulator [Achromobacter deleyi]CAB3708238.1 HTH-type transcriptional regulator CynR [Achromobacter deleyi]CAB3866378.1 HTH-type transcriptional regulator CynR [Achromobacter deleyi]CAB3877885.1 HTH-type transcriptional regulator CynR [Achromobacter deleyi]